MYYFTHHNIVLFPDINSAEYYNKLIEKNKTPILLLQFDCKLWENVYQLSQFYTKKNKPIPIEKRGLCIKELIKWCATQEFIITKDECVEILNLYRMDYEPCVIDMFVFLENIYITKKKKV